MLDREPEESVPRLLTNTRTSGSTTMVRYGIALLLESNFASTPLGRQVYLYNIEQIRIASMETASYGAMISILQHPPHEDQWSKLYNDDTTMSRQFLDRRFKEETAMWGIVHKERGGYDSIRRKLTKIMADRNNGNSGDFTVVPCGMQQYMKETTDAKYYLDGVSGARKNLVLLGSAVVESRGFSQGDHSLPHDPCFRHQTIGGFQTLDDHLLSSMDVADYRTDFLDSYGYDEDKDEFHRFRYKNMYQYSGVWNFREANAPLTDGIGRGFCYDMHCYTWGQALKKSTDFGRVVEKIYQITDAEKRAEFECSLRQLPADDPRVTKCQEEGLGFPLFRMFDRNQFDAMCGGDIKFDETYSVSKRLAFDAKLRHSGGHYHVPDAAHEYLDFSRKRQREEADEMGPRHIASIRGGVDYRGVAYAAGDAMDMDPPTQSRFERGRRPEVGGGGDEVSIRKLLGELEALKEWTGDELIPVADRDVNAKERTEAIMDYAQKIAKRAGVSATMKITLLSELLRVLRSESQYYTRDPEPISIQNIYTLMAANFAPFVGAMEVRIALDAIQRNQRTPLEVATAEDKDSAGTEAQSGWFQHDSTPTRDPKKPLEPAKPGEPLEDGRIKLDVFGLDASQQVGIPLDHDAFAITLSANNTRVLFSLDNKTLDALSVKKFDVSKDIHAGHATKRARTNQLVWNMALTVLHHEVLRDPAVMAEKALTFLLNIEAGDFDRLCEVAASSPACDPANVEDMPKVLLSQEHLIGRIKALDNALRMILNVRASVDPAKKLPGVKPVVDKSALSVTAELAKLTEKIAAYPKAEKRNPDRKLQDELDVVLSRGYTRKMSRMEADADRKEAAEAAEEKRPVVPMPDYPSVSTGLAGAWSKAEIANALMRASLVSGSFYKFCVDNNVPLAFYLRSWRPHKTYNMGSTIRMISGLNGAARTLYKCVSRHISFARTQSRVWFDQCSDVVVVCFVCFLSRGSLTS
jgi:hypothetical protein